MIALALLLCLSAASAESSVVRSPAEMSAIITETATLHAHIEALFVKADALKREATERRLECCTQNATCKDAVDVEFLREFPEYLEPDWFFSSWREQSRTVFEAACPNDPAMVSKEREAKNSVSLALDARSRITLLQVDFYREANSALHFKDQILFDDHSEVWGLRQCFSCFLRSADDELTCSIFNERMAAIEGAVGVMITEFKLPDPLFEEELRGGCFESMMTYLIRNHVHCYMWRHFPGQEDPRRKLRKNEDVQLICVPLLICALLVFAAKLTLPVCAGGSKNRNAPWFRDGKGKYCDGCCAVCLGEDSLIPWTTVTRCEHSFHAECMDELLSYGTTLCPWCSRNMFASE